MDDEAKQLLRSLTYVNSDVLSENAIGTQNVPLPGAAVT
jgi:hypothetical protein